MTHRPRNPEGMSDIIGELLEVERDRLRKHLKERISYWNKVRIEDGAYHGIDTIFAEKMLEELGGILAAIDQ